jgi:neutral ceramidase
MGRADITVYEPGMCMFGWGQPENTALGVAHPLFARALVVEAESGGRLAYVCADLGFISQHLRQRVIELLAQRDWGLGEHEVMITATHTHSGPNGYSTYLFYGVTGPGFSPRVVDGLARGIVLSIEKAIANLVPSTLHLHRTEIPLSEPVSFNRSIAAYNLNADVAKVPADRSDEAIDRTMVLLRVDDARGKAQGFVCWFPVHGTSIHYDNTLIHPDNKGVAARLCEERAGDDAFVAIFAQEAAGDVSPNYRWHAGRRLLIGRHDDDFASAEFNGAIQAKHAWDAFVQAATRGEEVHGLLKGRIRYRDFTSLTVDPEFAGGREGQTTTMACLGLGFTYGTLEGPGPGFALRRLNPLWTRLVGWRRARRPADWRTQHGPKPRFFDLGLGARGNVMKILPMLPPGLRHLPDARVAYYSRVIDSDELGSNPWVPQVLPAHLFCIGSLAIAGIPAEPTTVSGRRLRAAAGSALFPMGVRHVVVNGYANAYAAYVTTYEEYQLQHYEAASTLFGQWTLAAWCTELRALSKDVVAGDYELWPYQGASSPGAITSTGRPSKRTRLPGSTNVLNK